MSIKHSAPVKAIARSQCQPSSLGRLYSEKSMDKPKTVKLTATKDQLLHSLLEQTENIYSKCTQYPQHFRLAWFQLVLFGDFLYLPSGIWWEQEWMLCGLGAFAQSLTQSSFTEDWQDVFLLMQRLHLCLWCTLIQREGGQLCGARYADHSL